MKVNLTKITSKDGFDGLKVLQQVTKENFDESPLPFKINDYWYQGFLKLCEEESEKNICIAYWINQGKKKVGYAEIRPGDNQETGNIGIILENTYQSKGIGYETMKLLVDIAKNEYKMKNIEIITNPNNTGMRKTCEKLNAQLIDMDEKCHYCIK